MKQKRWQTAEFGLISKKTGEIFDAELRIAKKTGGKFMKLWQDTGWEKHLGELQGASLKVLFHLTMVAGWRNEVPGPSEVARQKGKHKQHISRSYAELIKAGFLYKRDSSYWLSPLFCWKGDDEQYNEALQELNFTPKQRLTTLTSALLDR